MPTVNYIAGAELPPLTLKFTDSTGTPIDLTNFTCTVKVAKSAGSPVLVTRTGTGSAQGMSIQWQAGDLSLPGGQYICEAQARNASNLDYKRTFTLTIEPSL